MLPFEFIVIGTPLSHQTHNRQRLQEWKSHVARAASERWSASWSPVTSDVRITVEYFHERPTVRIDGDNLLKPIQDAMIGLIYADDHQVVDAIIQKRNIDDAFRVRRMSPVLALGFIRGDEFVYVRVEDVVDRTRIVT